jgi:hypothetical protein
VTPDSARWRSLVLAPGSSEVRQSHPSWPRRWLWRACPPGAARAPQAPAQTVGSPRVLTRRRAPRLPKLSLCGRVRGASGTRFWLLFGVLSSALLRPWQIWGSKHKRLHCATDGAGFGLPGALTHQDTAAARMLRWLIGGGREPQGLAEVNPADPPCAADPRCQSLRPVLGACGRARASLCASAGRGLRASTRVSVRGAGPAGEHARLCARGGSCERARAPLCAGRGLRASTCVFVRGAGEQAQAQAQACARPRGRPPRGPWEGNP